MRSGASIYHRADGRWEARYKKGRDEKGRLVYGFVYGDTQEEVEKKRKEAIVAFVESIKEESENEKDSILPTINPNLSVITQLNKNPSVKVRERIQQPYTDIEAAQIEACLVESSEPFAVGAYLSLNMGFSLSEIMALRYGDIDLEKGIITVKQIMVLQRAGSYIEECAGRTVMIPEKVKCFLYDRNVCEQSPDGFVLTGDSESIKSYQTVTAKMRSIIDCDFPVSAHSVNSLRSTFIRKCLEANINVESISLISGMDKAIIYRYFGKYIKANADAIMRLDENYSPKGRNRRLNLLIIGAGSHGHTVKETAEKLGVFNKIQFLDDAVQGPDVIGKFSDYVNFVDEFPCAFVALGNNEKRRYCSEKLKNVGYMLPRLIHPDATVSKDAKIGDGTIVMAQATVNAAYVGDLCIVASNALINFGAVLGNYSHVDCGGIVMKDADAPQLTFVESGEIYNK